MKKSPASACACGETNGGAAVEDNRAGAGKQQSAGGTSEPERFDSDMEPFLARYANGAVFLCGTRFFMYEMRRSACPRSRDGP